MIYLLNKIFSVVKFVKVLAVLKWSDYLEAEKLLLKQVIFFILS